MESQSGYERNLVRLQTGRSGTTNGVLVRLRTQSSETTDGILVGLQTKCSETTNSVLVLILKLAARPSRFTQGTTLVVPNIYVLILWSHLPNLTFRTGG